MCIVSDWLLLTIWIKECSISKSKYFLCVSIKDTVFLGFLGRESTFLWCGFIKEERFLKKSDKLAVLGARINEPWFFKETDLKRIKIHTANN